MALLRVLALSQRLEQELAHCRHAGEKSVPYLEKPSFQIISNCEIALKSDFKKRPITYCLYDTAIWGSSGATVQNQGEGTCLQTSVGKERVSKYVQEDFFKTP